MRIDGGDLKLVDGEAKENLIGIHIGAHPEEYDFAACCDSPSVSFIGNETRLSGSYLPKPSIDAPPPCPDFVPWE